MIINEQKIQLLDLQKVNSLSFWIQTGKKIGSSNNILSIRFWDFQLSKGLQIGQMTYWPGISQFLHT
jgi:hypothetical protein